MLLIGANDGQLPSIISLVIVVALNPPSQLIEVLDYRKVEFIEKNLLSTNCNNDRKLFRSHTDKVEETEQTIQNNDGKI